MAKSAFMFAIITLVLTIKYIYDLVKINKTIKDDPENKDLIEKRDQIKRNLRNCAIACVVCTAIGIGLAFLVINVLPNAASH